MTQLGPSISSKITNNDDCDKIGVEVTMNTVIVENGAGGEYEELESGSGLKSITPGESTDKSGGGIQGRSLIVGGVVPNGGIVILMVVGRKSMSK